jgi:hypothetical protein
VAGSKSIAIAYSLMFIFGSIARAFYGHEKVEESGWFCLNTDRLQFETDSWHLGSYFDSVAPLKAIRHAIEVNHNSIKNSYLEPG